jgi:MT0933-like antitoxin protein
MGIFDKAKDLAREHNEQVDQGIDKGAEIVDEKTGGQHTQQVQQGVQHAKDALDGARGEEQA